MRKITTILLLSLTFLYAAEGFAQRGIGTNLPDRSSVLHLESGTRGLLIPRVVLEQTTLPTPINAPANSLLVYNLTESSLNNDVRPGYYYWDTALNGGAGAWAALLDSKSAGENIKIAADGTISIQEGIEGQVLVTVEENGELISKWVDISDILEDLLDVKGENGITVGPLVTNNGITTYTVELGGALIKETTITASAGIAGEPDNSLTIESGENYFHITNLNDIEVGINGQIKLSTDTGDDGTGNIFKNTFDVLIVDKTTGLVQRVSIQDLLRSAIDAKNGLTYDRDENVIKLGGDLIEETTITLDGNEFIIDTSADNSDPNSPQTAGDFKIKGLEETATANKIMVVDDLTNTVRTVTRVISHDISATTTIDTDFADYSPYVHEVNINVTALDAEINLVLPVATAANEGQVINIRLTITDESGNYLNIKKDNTTPDNNSNVLTWGALPFQGWVLKSVGGENNPQWLIVSSN